MAKSEWRGSEKTLLQIFIVFFLLAAFTTKAATSEETKVFDAAKKSFRFTAYREAEADLARFVETYTNSTLIPEAVLYLAEARIKLTNYDGAISLLQSHRAAAGKWADEYIFWQGEARLLAGQYEAAAVLLAELARDFPGSTRCLDAAIGQAEALGRTGNWPAVVALLGQTNGAYQRAVRANPGTELAARGGLWLCEGELALKDYVAAEAALNASQDVPLSPALEWQRQYLMCRIRLGQKQLEEALSACTNLLALATGTGQSRLMAESLSFQAGLFEKLGRVDEAIAAYTNNLAANLPEALQSQALLRIADLCLSRDRVPEALRWLEKFAAEKTNAPADLALLTLGELRLRQAVAPETNSLNPALARTNLLEDAMAPLLRLKDKFPLSPSFGKANLDLGWCYSLVTNLPLALASFQTATARLPVSADLATAYFKTGDIEFLTTNYSAALTNYLAAVDLAKRRREFSESDWQLMETNLLERALYQAVRAALATTNLPAATLASDRLLEWYPNGFHTDHAVLLAGQVVSRQRDPAGARALLLELLEKATNSPLRSKAQLAVARTYAEEGNYERAIYEYGRWLDDHTNDQNRPFGEFERAWAYGQAGHETNALNLLTNLVARFPTNPITTQAILWIADYFFRTGNFLEAEKNYQLLFNRETNGPSELPYQAQMMAGRSAVQRQAWSDATNYFSNIFHDHNCPADLAFQAMFAYGDILLSLEPSGPDKLANVKNALEVFTVIGDSSNHLAPLAWGEQALCYFQYQPPQFLQASNELQRIIDSRAPAVDATARAIARVGLAALLKRQAELCAQPQKTELLDLALAQYRKVLGEDDLPPGWQPTAAYWSWVKRAGLEAAPLAEDLRQWSQAAMIYKQLQDLLPPLRAALEEKRIRAEKNQIVMPP